MAPATPDRPKMPEKRVKVVNGQRVVTNHPLRWTVYHRETGEAVERTPIDAKELVATGHYTWEPPVAPAAEACDPPHHTVSCYTGETPCDPGPPTPDGEQPAGDAASSGPAEERPAATEVQATEVTSAPEVHAVDVLASPASAAAAPSTAPRGRDRRGR